MKNLPFGDLHIIPVCTLGGGDSRLSFTVGHFYRESSLGIRESSLGIVEFSLGIGESSLGIREFS